jgi:hypothetical protein
MLAPMRLAMLAVLALTVPARAGGDPYAPVPMLGPFTSIEAFCTDSLAIYTDPQVRAILEPRCTDSIQTLATAKVAAPYEEMRLVKIPELSGGFVAVKLDGGWYLRGVEPFEAPPNCHGPLAFEGLTARPDHALQIAYAIDGDCERRDHEWTWLERGFVVVGIGPSGAPSMTAPIRLAVTETSETDGKPPRQTFALARSAKWRGDGSVDITNLRRSNASRGEADPVGRHRFAFP